MHFLSARFIKMLDMPSAAPRICSGLKGEEKKKHIKRHLLCLVYTYTDFFKTHLVRLIIFYYHIRAGFFFQNMLEC